MAIGWRRDCQWSGEERPPKPAKVGPIITSVYLSVCLSACTCPSLFIYVSFGNNILNQAKWDLYFLYAGTSYQYL